jgi:hypothetical protein
MAPFFSRSRDPPDRQTTFLRVANGVWSRDEDLADTTALHANAFDSMQVVYQPIQRPAGVVLSQIAGIGERYLDDAADFLWSIGHRSTRARRFFHPLQSLLMKAMEPIAYHPFTNLKLLGNLGSRLSLTGQPDDLRAFQFPNGRVARMHQSLNRLSFFLAQFSHSQHPFTSLFACFSFSFLKVYHSCRMHHLGHPFKKRALRIGERSPFPACKLRKVGVQSDVVTASSCLNNAIFTWWRSLLYGWYRDPSLAAEE